MPTPVKILILAANPRKDLNLDREIRGLRNVIEKSHNRENFEVVDALAVRIEDLQELFLEHQPQIVHFCGHGSGNQGLVFDSEKGGEQVDTEALYELLKLSSETQPIQCILLNACYTEVQAEVFANYIDYVIGMEQEIQDRAAIAFSTGFYRALGYGRSINECYKYGCNAIQLLLGKSDLKEQQRKLAVEGGFKNVIIPEHLKPTLKTKKASDIIHPYVNTASSAQINEIQVEINKVLEQGKIIEYQDQNHNSEQEKKISSAPSQPEGIPDFLNHLLEDYFSKSSLKWSLCFTGEDQSRKLGELTGDLRNGFSGTGNGKQIPSGFSYWGLISTLAWESACSDQLYPVMKESSSSFSRRWNEISDENFAEQKYHYVSLGVGIGDKDNDILKCLYNRDNSVRYFPIDMSSTMLRLGVQNATKGIPLKGSNVLPIQIDFSFKSNIVELRQLLNEIDNNDPILFSLLGNTLANFQDDVELLKTLSKLMRNSDKLLLEVATTEELSEEAAAAAAKEYANAPSFKKFVTSALLEYTDLHIDPENVCYEGSIEPDSKALFVKILYRNLAKETISITLPDRETVDFKSGDTIRLLTTRKYTSTGISKVISDSNLRVIDSSTSLLGGRNQYGFGIDLILLTKESA